MTAGTGKSVRASSKGNGRSLGALPISEANRGLIGSPLRYSVAR
jgi:hypothetical protein